MTTVLDNVASLAVCIAKAPVAFEAPHVSFERATNARREHIEARPCDRA